MPHISDKIKLQPYQDRRRKLNEDQKEEIRKLYSSTMYSSRKLAEMYGVSKSLILIIVNPSRAESIKQRTKEHWRDYRPSKEVWAKTMREHRAYKHSLYLKGELK